MLSPFPPPPHPGCWVATAHRVSPWGSEVYDTQTKPSKNEISKVALLGVSGSSRGSRVEKGYGWGRVVRAEWVVNTAGRAEGWRALGNQTQVTPSPWWQAERLAAACRRRKSCWERLLTQLTFYLKPTCFNLQSSFLVSLKKWGPLSCSPRGPFYSAGKSKHWIRTQWVLPKACWLSRWPSLFVLCYYSWIPQTG